MVPNDDLGRLRKKWIELLSTYPPFRRSIARDLWLESLPDAIRTMVTERDPDCNLDLELVFNQAQGLRLEDGRFALALLLTYVIDRTQGTSLADQLRALQQDLEQRPHKAGTLAAELYPPPSPVPVKAPPLPTGPADAKTDVMQELREWKKVHHGSQELLNAIDIPLTCLAACHSYQDIDALRMAGKAWKRTCRPLLENIPQKWELLYARSPALGSLQEQTMQDRLTDLTAQFMSVEPGSDDLLKLRRQVEDLQEIMWDLLTTADVKIVSLLQVLEAGGE